jgi:hypothetical protein
MSKVDTKKIDSIISTTKDATLKSILFNLKLVPTFSLMIDATYEPIHQYLIGEYPTLDNDAIVSIAVAATAQFIFKSYDRFKRGQDFKDYLEMRGLQEKVDKTKTVLTKLLKIGADVLKDMGYTTATMSGILGFAVLLQPLMSGITALMGRNSDFSVDNIFNYIVLGVTFKGAMFVEQLLKKIVEDNDKDPEVEPKDSDDEKTLSESELKDIMKSIILR